MRLLISASSFTTSEVLPAFCAYRPLSAFPSGIFFTSVPIARYCTYRFSLAAAFPSRSAFNPLAGISLSKSPSVSTTSHPSSTLPAFRSFVNSPAALFTCVYGVPPGFGVYILWICAISSFPRISMDDFVADPVFPSVVISCIGNTFITSPLS